MNPIHPSKSPASPFKDSEILRALDPRRLPETEDRIRALQKRIGERHLIHGDETALAARAPLDALPFLIQQPEWQTIQAGLEQRARLFTELYRDIYGPQNLLRDGLIPDELVWKNPHFLPPCVLPQAQKQSPFFHGCDLLQDEAGQYWLDRDRNTLPDGLGFTLQSRIVLARLYPDLLEHFNVHRLAPFLSDVRSGLRQLAQTVDPNRQARVVILSPGASSPAYFEHAYLAAYLGFTLIQGQDLLVRNGAVWIKAIDGLGPVDVIFRQTGDGASDPLELDPTAFQGIPGLVEATRRGTVSLANPLGGQALENYGLHPFLHAVCRHVLGEKLKIPQIPSWWCGQKKEREYVLENLASLEIRSATGNQVFATPRKGMSKAELESLAGAIRSAPGNFVGRRLPASKPELVSAQGDIRGWDARLRFFSFRIGNDIRCLPGGFAEAHDPDDPTRQPRQKDIWLCGADAKDQKSSPGFWPRNRKEIRQAVFTGLYTSRTAEHLLWCGRYAERASMLVDSLRRLLRNDEFHVPKPSQQRCDPALWQGIRALLGLKKQAETSAEAESIQDLLADTISPSSLYSSLDDFRYNATAIRENWSVESWNLVAEIAAECEALFQMDRRSPPEQMEELLNRLILRLDAFSGRSLRNMNRTPGWVFLYVGQHLELLLMQCTLWEHSLTSALESDGASQQLLDELLEQNNSLISYRRMYRSEPEFTTVFQLFIVEKQNPRSISFSLQELHRGVIAIQDLFRNSLQDRPMDVDFTTELNAAMDAIHMWHEQSWESTEQQTADTITLLKTCAEKVSKTYQEIDRRCLHHARVRPRQIQTLSPPEAIGRGAP